jgi:hypothetical protein
VREYLGTCSCGGVEIRLFSELSPSEFHPRSDAQTCRFCSEHDGVWISDAKGALRLRAGDTTRVRSFGSEQVQFHFCAACNTLVYASFDAARLVAVVRIALFEEIRAAGMPVLSTNFEGESVEVGRQRRLDKWTPFQRG